jgi:hypothetical protein
MVHLNIHRLYKTFQEHRRLIASKFIDFDNSVSYPIRKEEEVPKDSDGKWMCYVWTSYYFTPVLTVVRHGTNVIMMRVSPI